ncbi:hypothetical protein [Erwinia sp. Leaf53]|uniref:hypothetical protein n=1 Tax=Erwinia sp. Leaf53 TaxID=1736225 RepID=UPI0006F27419|nr:hypothetical protein [Erwinia sp. Leaf53]KQN63275.1 hypothetical protein ASF13_19910 [Erwinia sp. Leaf53]
MGEQYRMSRQQRVSFTEEESKLIDEARNLMTATTGKPVTTNRFIKVTTNRRADKINNGDTNGSA